MSQLPNTPEQAVRVMQIITGAMALGVVMFGGIALFVGVLGEQPDGMLISALGAGFAGIAFVMHLLVPSLIASQQARDASEQQLYGIFLSKTIIGLAILEGAAFFNLVAAIVEHNWWSLAIAGGLVFWMLAMFPTRTRVDHWVETQQIRSQTEAG